MVPVVLAQDAVMARHGAAAALCARAGRDSGGWPGQGSDLKSSPLPSMAENSAVVPRYGECAVAGLDGLFLSRRPKPMGRRRTHWDFKSGWATQSWSDLKSDQASRAGHDGCSVLAQTGCPPEQAKRVFPSRPARRSHQRGPTEINRLSIQPVGCAHWAQYLAQQPARSSP